MKKKYPYGDIPSLKVMERFRDSQPRTSYYELPPESPEERKLIPFGPMKVEEGEIEQLFQRYKDWDAVYACYNMD